MRSPGKCVGFVNVVGIILLGLTTLAQAQITETDAVQLGLNNPQIKEKLNAQIEKARGEARRAGKWENPSIEYSRETLDLSDGESVEQTYWLYQTINIAGVKGLEREAAAQSFKAEELRLALSTSLLQKSLREGFYKIIAAEQKHQKLSQSKDKLRTIKKMVEQRVSKGDASRFDALRVEKELASVVSKGASAESTFLGLRDAFFVLVSAPVQPLAGDLLPASTMSADFQWNQHPDLQAIQTEIQSLELSAKAASRERWPELTLGVGKKELSEPGFDADGNTVSVGISIPIFDSGSGERTAAASHARELKADHALVARQLNVDYATARQLFITNKRAAMEIQELNAHTGRALSELAEASYQAGEISVIELLDAYQSDIETTEQYIDAALAARLAYIQLQYLRGE